MCIELSPEIVRLYHQQCSTRIRLAPQRSAFGGESSCCGGVLAPSLHPGRQKDEV